jgi:hypothetical protein
MTKNLSFEVSKCGIISSSNTIFSHMYLMNLRVIIVFDEFKQKIVFCICIWWTYGKIIVFCIWWAYEKKILEKT